MPDRTIEVERKFTAPAALAPDFRGLVEEVGTREFALEATYHDTPACLLADAGWSLRRRVGGKDDGWHLKRPASGAGRTEVWAPDEPTIPEAMRQEVREVTGLAAIVPIALVQTHRVETTLARAGVPVATLARDTVRSTTSSGTDSWSEVEVELEPGAPPSLLDALADRLLAAGAQPAPHTSKIARGLAAVPRLHTPTSPDAPARDVLLTWASRQIGVLQALESGVRADAPDHVHKSRVATRRLRSLMKTFARLFDAERTGPVLHELRWLGARLGVPRDAEVLREEFGDLLAELGDDVPPDVRRALLGHLSSAHDSAHAELVEALAGPRALALRGALLDLVVNPPFTSRANREAGVVLPPERDKAIRAVAKLRRRAEADPDHLEHWHDIRKAAKAVRYATEAMADAIPGLDAEVVAWEDVTEALGELQDTAVAGELIVTVAREASADPDAGVWRVLRDAQLDRRTAALAQGRAALAAVLDQG